MRDCCQDAGFLCVFQFLRPISLHTYPCQGEEPQSVKGRAGALTFLRVDTVNIYVTVVNGSVGDDPSLITVQGQ